MAGGISCGFFTSPHLVDIRERFQIDGQMASREDFTEVFNQVKEKIDEKRYYVKDYAQYARRKAKVTVKE